MRAQVLADAGGRCGYCLSSEEITGTPLEIEHIVPEALGGLTTQGNLWAVCRYCNLLKSDQVAVVDPDTTEFTALFNPRTQRWSDHFVWSEGGLYIRGRTPIGRATVVVLDLNRALLVRARAYWMSAGWHPPKDSDSGP